MGRDEFMKQLERLLQNLPSAEREAALQYYNDYFDDAGAENEKEVIEALGNPARVAENIKRDLNGTAEGDRAKGGSRALVEYGKDVPEGGGEGGQGTAEKKSGSTLPTWAIVLLVVLLVLASPVLLAIGASALAMIIGIVVTWAALIFAFGVTALALLVAFGVLAVVGIWCIAADPLIGAGVIGCGLICGGVGLLFFLLTTAMGGMATPAIWKAVMGLFRKKTPAKAHKGV